ncbi:hypothetical protein V5E97_36065 [Singulisphaera sp. Ch08]|uniref:Tetratricopeptide repeat protein n=1 Tax=Singulisphaera sp. Ch08 TaxID=3120278 RepID=A0AAU7CE01_9BACT
MTVAPDVTVQDAEPFHALEQTLGASGPRAVLDQLVDRLAERGEFRALLDALLLRARHELGLPLIQVGSLSELPEPARSQYEERYVEAIRSVGDRLLNAGEIASAWPYFRAIGEPEPVRRAIDAYQAIEGDEQINQIVEVAFNQGANPRRGFELILEHYGTCSAISAFEHLPPDEATRVACSDRLVRQLHDHLVANLRAEIAQHGQPLPPDGSFIPALIAGNDWLFFEDAYHIDISHLSATVRLAPMLTDPETLIRAAGLCEYGRRLSERHQYEGEAPFEKTFDDHAVYLAALLGQDVDAALAHFRQKIDAPEPDRPENSLPAQIFVGLLVRLGRLDQAIEVAAEHLAGLPESTLGCPSVAQLCQRAGQPDRLAAIARKQGDLVNFTAALLQTALPTSSQPGSGH